MGELGGFMRKIKNVKNDIGPVITNHNLTSVHSPTFTLYIFP